MVGIGDIFSGSNFAKGLSSLSTASARPNFELQFSLLQNTIIDQLNEKIEQASADSGLANNVDAFLISAEKKLVRFSNDLIDFTFDNNRNINAVGELTQQVEELDAALAGDDFDAFNNTLGLVNDTVSKTTVTNGATVGIFISDGIENIRRDGLLSYDNAGTTTKATQYTDFADKAAAQAAVDAARTELASIAQVVLLKAESAEKLRENSDTKLSATVLQIQAAQIADEADKAAEIGKIRDEYSQLLNSISLSFEVSFGLADQLAANLFDPDRVPGGSAVNIIL